MILLPGTDCDGGKIVAERLLKAMAEVYVETGGEAARVTASIGLASTVPVRDEISEHLIQRADQALYKAKAAGRNCFREAL